MKTSQKLASKDLPQVGAGRDAEALIEFDAVPGQAAIPVGQHVEQRETAAQVFVDHVRAPDLMRTPFTQHEQAGARPNSPPSPLTNQPSPTLPLERPLNICI